MVFDRFDRVIMQTKGNENVMHVAWCELFDLRTAVTVVSDSESSKAASKFQTVDGRPDSRNAM